ncbi:MAG: AMP-binding protein [Oceanospirillaceae bacterium]|nr:AMP-binding protein [Oceanospirillaceae bacterium]
MQSSSYTKGDTRSALLQMTIGEVLDRSVERYPENDALIVVEQNIHYSYREFQQQVNLIALAFIGIGVKKGERIGIWSPNCVEWVLCQFASAKIGAILVNVNPAYQAYELEFTLKQSGIRYLVMADKFKKSDYCQILHSIAPELKDCQSGALRAAKIPDLRWVIQLSTTQQPGMCNWQDFKQYSAHSSAEQLAEIQGQLHFDDPINIQYTSGTTGSPKGVTLSHYNIINNGYFVGQSMKFSAADRLIIPIPLYHCFGMVMGNLGCVSHGATMIYPSAAFDPGKVLAAVQEHRATALYAVPTMFISMLEHPPFDDFDLSSLRTGIMAGSICPAEIMKAVNGKMHIGDLQIAYGMTETSPVSAQTASDDPFDKRVSTVGRTQPHLETKIIDPESGIIVARGTTGELCTRGYSVMLGYWQNPAATATVIEADGWMHSGDLAIMDEAGYLRIVGRIKDMVIRGGENIYPKEVEDFLYSHPQISDVQVVGVPDPKYGEELLAWIKLRPGANPLTEEQLKEYCRGKISHFKIPRYVKFVSDYPLTVTGKVQKYKIRELAITELALHLPPVPQD